MSVGRTHRVDEDARGPALRLRCCLVRGWVLVSTRRDSDGGLR